MFGNIIKAVRAPRYTYYYMLGKTSPGMLFKRYAKLAESAGLKKLYFVLSFDCDTLRDMDTVWEVHSRLREMNVMPVYAVPGEILKQGAGVYRRIADDGAEFINHGSAIHTLIDETTGAYHSCLFYDRISRDAVERDIVEGDRAVFEITGKKPIGFRVPHFGTFQETAQLQFLHSALNKMNYAYSTSTVPYYGFLHGPIIKRFGLMEFPVSGMWSSPLTILDTWGCFCAPNRTFGPSDYYEEGKRTAAFMHSIGSAGILNYYADPSHICKSTEFFETVKYWAEIGENITYEKLIENL